MGTEDARYPYTYAADHIRRGDEEMSEIPCDICGDEGDHPSRIVCDACLQVGRKRETGLCDTNGRMICIGDRVRLPVTYNKEVHGEWAIYEVALRATIPILLYLRSEKGEVLPGGYMATRLSDSYHSKMFLFATDITKLRPMDDLVVVEEQ